MNSNKAIFGFGAVTLVKALSGLIIVKLLALKFGPADFGVISQWLSVVAIVNMFSGGGITNGLIASISRSNDINERQKILGAGLSIFIFSSLIITIVFFIFSGEISEMILGVKYAGIFFFSLAIIQWFFGINNIIIAIMSFSDKVANIIKINFYGCLLGTTLFILLIYLYDLYGAYFGVLLYSGAPSIIAIILILKNKNLFSSKMNFSRNQLFELIKYSFLMILSVLCLPIAQIIVRNILAEHFDWSVVGYWQATIKLSDVYMQFVGVFLINFVLPKLAKFERFQEAIYLLIKIMVPVLLLLTIGFLVLYLLRNIVITVIFSSEFLPASDYILPQVIGDFFRIISSSIVYLFLSKGNKVIPAFFEILQALGLLFLVNLMISYWGKLAPVYASLSTYILIFVFLSVITFLRSKVISKK